MSWKLKYEECIKIQTFLEEWYSDRKIGRKLWRSNSTISDEIKRYWTEWNYNAKIARLKRQTKKKLNNALHCKIKPWDLLDTFIIEKIKQYWSPEQIAWRWKRETWKTISKDTIYKHIKENYPELIKKYFRRSWKKYKYGTIKADYIRDRKSIHERPIEATLKLQEWHREWDTVRWSRKTWWLLTFTEKISWYELAWKLDTKRAEEISMVAFELFCELPRNLKRTITLDNWREFIEHYIWKDLFWIEGIYFADIGMAWQRWLNENTNWLLRQFFPKKTSLAKTTQEEIDYYVEILNNRPRKRLQFLTPTEFIQKYYCAVLK